MGTPNLACTVGDPGGESAARRDRNTAVAARNEETARYVEGAEELVTVRIVGGAVERARRRDPAVTAVRLES